MDTTPTLQYTCQSEITESDRGLRKMAWKSSRDQSSPVRTAQRRPRQACRRMRAWSSLSAPRAAQFFGPNQATAASSVPMAASRAHRFSFGWDVAETNECRTCATGKEAGTISRRGRPLHLIALAILDAVAPRARTDSPQDDRHSPERTFHPPVV